MFLHPLRRPSQPSAHRSIRLRPRCRFSASDLPADKSPCRQRDWDGSRSYRSVPHPRRSRSDRSCGRRAGTSNRRSAPQRRSRRRTWPPAPAHTQPNDLWQDQPGLRPFRHRPKRIRSCRPAAPARRARRSGPRLRPQPRLRLPAPSP